MDPTSGYMSTASLTTLTDAQLLGATRLGLAVVTYDDGPVDVRFDNLLVRPMCYAEGPLYNSNASESEGLDSTWP